MLNIEDEIDRVISKNKTGNLFGTEEVNRIIELLKIQKDEISKLKEGIGITNKKLDAARSIYRNFFNNSPIGFMLTNQLGLILQINSSAELIFETTTMQVENTLLEAFLDPKGVNQYYEHLVSVSEAKTVQSVILQLKIPLSKNSYKTKYISVNTFLSGTDKYLASLIDVTSQIEAQEQVKAVNLLLSSTNEELTRTNKELIESEQKFNVAFKANPIPVGILDCETGVFIRINYTLEQLIGLRESDILNRTPVELHLISQSKFLLLRKLLIEKKEIQPFELQICDNITLMVFVELMSVGKNRYLYLTGIDMTQIKRKETKLSQNTERFRLAHKVARIGTWERDFELGTITWEENTCNIFGRTKSQFLLTIDEFELYIHPLDRKSVLEAQSAAIAKRAREYSCQYRILRNGFIETWIHEEAMVVYEHGKPVKLVGILQDITEQRKAEDELRKSQLNLLALIENTDGYIWSVDRQLRLIVGNHAFHEYTRKKRGRVFDAGEYMLIGYKSSDYIKQWTNYYSRALRGEFFSVEVNEIIKGIELFYEYRFSGIYTSDGNIVGVTVYGRDITARKSTELQIKMLSSVVEQSPLAISVTDLTGRIEYINPSFTSISGYSFTEVKGINIHTFRTEKNDFDLLEAISSSLKKGDIWKGQLTRQRKNGEYYYEHIIISPVKNDNLDILRFFTIHEDITEKILIEQKLLQSARIIKATFDCTNESFVLVDSNLNVLAYNRAVASLIRDVYGKDIHEGDNMQHLMKDDFWREFSVYVNKGFSGEISEFEANTTSLNCGLDWIHAKFLPIVGTDGVIFAVAFTLFDITERKLFEQALLDSEYKFRQMFEQHSAIKFLVNPDEDGKIVDVNQAAVSFYGFSHEEFLEMRISDINIMSKKEVCDVLQLAKTKHANRFEFRHRLADGRIIDVEVHSSPITINGKMLLYSIIRDITERKLAEQQLIESYEKFKFLTQTAIDIMMLETQNEILNFIGTKLLNLAAGNLVLIVRFDMKNMKSMVYDLFVSDEEFLSQLNKIADTDFIGKYYDLHYKDKIIDVFKPRILEELSGGVLTLIKTRFPHWVAIKVQDSLRLEKVYNIGILVNNELYAGVCFFVKKSLTDVDKQFIEIFIQQANAALQERINSESIKLAKVEAEQANRTKSEFIANMSHEFRTPLNIILGFSEILKEKMMNQYENKNYVDGIFNSGKSLLNLINDILDISKIEAGRMLINPVTVDIRLFLNEIRKIFSLRATKKNLDFLLYIPESFPQFIKIDESRMRQVLFNLAGNAIKFTHTGVVQIVIGDYSSSADSGIISFSIFVKDTGIGIKEENLVTIFEPFRQQTDQNHAEYGGTGLGLSISKRLVEAMGGQLSVLSEVGKGSEFCVSMSNINVVESTRELEFFVDVDIKFEHATILIADDSVSVRQILKQYLLSYNFDIIEANNGRGLLQLLKVSIPDLIIVDFYMPEMDGPKAIKKLRENSLFSRIPVIGISSKQFSAEDVHLFDETLQKPILLTDLISVLVKYLPHKKSEVTNKDGFLFGEMIENREILEDKFVNELVKLSNEFKQAQNYFEVSKLIDLACRFENLSSQYRFGSLRRFAIDLKMSAVDFNIEKITELYEMYSKLLNRIL